MKKALHIAIALLCISMASVAQNNNEKVWERGDINQCPKNSQLENYFKKNFKYPSLAISNKEEGYFVASFVVEKNGTTSGVKVEVVIGEESRLLKEEVTRVMRNMPRWTPGKVDGKNVRVKMEIPVHFYYGNEDGYFITDSEDKINREKALKGKTTVDTNIDFSDPNLSLTLETDDDGEEIITIYERGSEPGVTLIYHTGVEDMVVEDIVETSDLLFYEPFIDDITEKEEVAVGTDDYIDTQMVGRKVFEKEKNEEPDDEVFKVVEQMPRFPGGDAAMKGFLDSHTKYPPRAEENGLQGRVACSVIIEKDGSINDVKVAKSVDPSLDKEAVRVIKSMPKWIPGRQNGKAVRVQYTIPVTFRLH